MIVRWNHVASLHIYRTIHISTINAKMTICRRACYWCNNLSKCNPFLPSRAPNRWGHARTHAYEDLAVPSRSVSRLNTDTMTTTTTSTVGTYACATQQSDVISTNSRKERGGLTPSRHHHIVVVVVVDGWLAGLAGLVNERRRRVEACLMGRTRPFLFSCERRHGQIKIGSGKRNKP